MHRHLPLIEQPVADESGFDPDVLVEKCLPRLSGLQAARLNGSRSQFGYFEGARLRFYSDDLDGGDMLWFFGADTGAPAFYVGPFPRVERPVNPASGMDDRRSARRRR